MSEAVFLLCFLYIGVLALIGQGVLLRKALDWLDRRYVQPWLAKRRP
jgi:hypothetical protein